ncbi:MAG TPA: TetR/AcrR family transcriptional regulator [Mycobacteriales bacterium]|jgi:AcrR family transcriptional regulator|nr:TetR/AcrR family transcriptional regulator [Mycobacteriales bacterium]
MTAVPRTRDRVLQEAARLFARRGFHGTSMEDLGAACGISGPALYKHFSSKDDVLGRLLVGISEQLLDGGREVAASAAGPVPVLRGLIAFHADFATSEPDLIRVQDRDLANLSEQQAAAVRSLQRRYVEVWISALRRVRDGLTAAQARIEVHGLFGLLNSTPHSGTTPLARRRLIAMAERAAGLP